MFVYAHTQAHTHTYIYKIHVHKQNVSRWMVKSVISMATQWTVGHVSPDIL